MLGNIIHEFQEILYNTFEAVNFTAFVKIKHS